MKNIVRQQHGFSIVEILVAFGLMSVLTLGIMKLFDNSTKTSKDIKNKDEITQLHQELTMILSNPTNCEANLGGASLLQNVMQAQGVQSFLNGERRSIHLIGPNRSEMDRRQRTTIVGARISNVDLNSPLGNNAIVDLEVTFEKPGVVYENPGDPNVASNRIGSKTVTRIIKIGASLCPRTLHFGNAQNPCPQNTITQSWQLVESNNFGWGICETCTDPNGTPVTQNSPIVSCNSIAAGGGGVNLDNLSATMCLRSGGSINQNGTCTPGNVAAQTAGLTPDQVCTALGGTPDTSTNPITCNGLQASLSNLTPEQLCTTLGGTPDTSTTPITCTGLPANNSSGLTDTQCTALGGDYINNTCENIPNLTQQINELRDQLNEQCVNFGGVVRNEVCDMKLFGGKSMQQCLDSRGQVIKVLHGGTSVNICRFDMNNVEIGNKYSYCPPGWTQLNNWSTTIPNTCYGYVQMAEGNWDVDEVFNCMQYFNSAQSLNGKAYASIVTTSSHSWDDKDNSLYGESISYFRQLCFYKDTLRCSGSYNYSLNASCTFNNDYKITGLPSSQKTCSSTITQVGCY
jgi:hypothetical protein